jgi:hypothetical protein
MRDAYELTRDGPYVRVVLPEVLPPDWDALEREIGEDVDEGATRVMLLAGDTGTLDTHRERLDAIVASLTREGVDAIVISQEDEPAVMSIPVA